MSWYALDDESSRKYASGETNLQNLNFTKMPEIRPDAKYKVEQKVKDSHSALWLGGRIIFPPPVGTYIASIHMCTRGLEIT